MVFLSPTEELPYPFPLMEAQVPIVGNDECDRKYHMGLSTGVHVRIIHKDMLCAGKEGRGSCKVSSCPLTLPPLPRLYKSTDPCPL